MKHIVKNPCYLVGIYILDMLRRFLDLNNIGIYRDDRLISIPNSNGPSNI